MAGKHSKPAAVGYMIGSQGPPFQICGRHIAAYMNSSFLILTINLEDWARFPCYRKPSPEWCFFKDGVERRDQVIVHICEVKRVVIPEPPEQEPEPELGLRKCRGELI